VGLNHVAYECLSFFKILNVFLDKGPAQQAWINANVANLTEPVAKRRAAFLAKTEGDVGKYLYASNRCAVAHAYSTPTVDPEDPVDLRRLRDDLPLVRALAEYAIEHHFGVKSAMTVYREHLYELEGFRPLVGADKINTIKLTGSLPEAYWPALPNLSIRLAHHERYAPLEDLRARVVAVDQGCVRVLCTSADGLLEFGVALNFRDERLQIDIESGTSSHDDGSERAARLFAAVTRFCHDYLMNGILEIWDSGGNGLLGRCDAFLPMNVDMGATHRNYQQLISRIEAEADQRAAAAPAKAEPSGG
jgi:hypothetical protein